MILEIFSNFIGSEILMIPKHLKQNLPFLSALQTWSYSYIS